VHLLLDGVGKTGTQLHRCSLQKTLEGGRLILPMNGERFERHRALLEDIAYGGISAQEIAEKYGLSLEGIQQFSPIWAKDEVADGAEGAAVDGLAFDDS
jgi:hypothetical protein